MLDHTTLDRICTSVCRRFPSLDQDDAVQECLIECYMKEVCEERLAARIAKTNCLNLIEKASRRPQTVPYEAVAEAALQDSRDPARTVPLRLDILAFLEAAGENVRAAVTRRYLGYPPDATQAIKHRDDERIRRARNHYGDLLRTAAA
jgi:DNA-directed RNA polymerase specialized sigma24 family protein